MVFCKLFLCCDAVVVIFLQYSCPPQKYLFPVENYSGIAFPDFQELVGMEGIRSVTILMVLSQKEMYIAYTYTKKVIIVRR